jgi:membrane protease YdiL (CAAX protease family)
MSGRHGTAGVRALFQRLSIVGVKPRWYAVAVLLPAVIYLAGIWLYRVRGGIVGAIAFPGFLALILPLLRRLPFGPACEELGWRGYVLPLLQSRTTDLKSSLIVGTLWFCWHLPLVGKAGTLISGAPVTIASLALFLAYLTSIAILMTWVANYTRGSVFMAMMMHAGFNAVQPVMWFPDLPNDAFRSVSYWSVLPAVLFALAIIATFGPRRFLFSRDRHTSPGNSRGVA